MNYYSERCGAVGKIWSVWQQASANAIESRCRVRSSHSKGLQPVYPSNGWRCTTATFVDCYLPNPAIESQLNCHSQIDD
jgi:hypothetical protein